MNCIDKEDDLTVICLGDFSRIQTGIYIVKVLQYGKRYIDLDYPITFFVQKRNTNLRLK